MKNVYVHRKNGKITKITGQPEGSGELLPIDDVEVIEFNTQMEPTTEEIYDKTIQNQKLLKALVLTLNDGSFVPGQNIPKADLKQIILSKM